jgi:hypothetical protein
MISLVSRHGAVRAVIARRANNFSFFLTDTLMRLIVARANCSGLSGSRRTEVTSRANHALTLVF